MVHKITMFELHFDGANFAPSVDGTGKGSSEEHAETMETEVTSGESASGSRVPALLALVGVLAVASLVGVAVRRFRGDSDVDLDLEIEDRAEEDLLEERL